MKQAAIIHFNTPELTEALILSLRKVGVDWPVTVFDNSDRRPFKVKMKGVKVIDNTKGKYIDFEKELAKYPDKSNSYAKVSNYGSVKHMMSVQKLWELLPGGFVLMDSDILIRKDISFLWDEKYAAVGKVQPLHSQGRREFDRYMPFLLYMNVPLLVKNGARFFDPKRSWCLQRGEFNPANWYDTGACLLEDIRNTKPQLVGLNYHDLDTAFFHYGSASWRKTDPWDQTRWLESFKDLWEPEEGYKLGVVSKSDGKRKTKKG